MENVNSEFRKKLKNLLTKLTDIFERNVKLRDFKYKLYVGESVQPTAQGLRCLPYHMRRAIKEEIKRLEHLDINKKGEGLQDWISNLVVVPKNNGKVRLCLDARTINTGIKRETCPIPSLDSIFDEMHSSKVFAKLDLREAYM